MTMLLLLLLLLAPTRHMKPPCQQLEKPLKETETLQFAAALTVQLSLALGAGF